MGAALSFSLSLILLAAPSLADTCAEAAFQRAEFVASGASADPAYPPLVGSFVEDGRPDLFLETQAGFALLVNRGRSAPWETRPVSAHDVILGPFARAHAAATGDFDRDGHLDVLVRRATSISLLLGDGLGGFTETPDVPVDVGIRALLSADFDADGAPDVLVTGATSSSPVLVLRGDGHGSFAPARDTSIRLPAGFVSELDAADFDRDGHLDLLVTMIQGPRCGSHHVYRGDGAGDFTGPVASTGIYGSFATVADLDEDGYPDIVSICNSTFDVSVRVLPNQGTLAFPFTSGVIVSERFYGAAVADFDGDGHLDLVAGGQHAGPDFSSTRALYFLKGDGHGGLASPQRLFDDATVPVAADLDGDGRLDLVHLTADGRVLVRHGGCAPAGPAETTLLVPIVLSMAGVDGSSFGSDLVLTHRGGATAQVDATFTRSLAGFETRKGSGSLAAGVQSSLGFDATFTTFGLQPPPHSAWTARLRISGLASPEEVHAFVDIGGVVSIDGTTGGRAGVSFPAVPLEETLSGPSVVGWLRETAQDRTNLALVNAGGEAEGDLTLRVTVVSTDVEHPGSVTLPDVTLSPGGFVQIGRLLAASGLGASSGFARVERVTGTATYWSWGAMNDNANADGSIVPPLPLAGAARELVVPVLVETPSFSSELVVTNAGPDAKRVSFRWLGERFTLDLAPGEQIYVPSFVEWLRQRGAASAGPVGPTYAGALFTNVESGSPDGLFLGARTSTPGGGGRYGVFTPALPLAETAVGSAYVYGLLQSTERRANLALVNAGDEDDTFRVDLFDGASGLLVASLVEVSVPARGWRQLSSILAGSAPGVSNAYARITRTAGSSRFLAYAVVNDGGSPGEGSGDGSYIPMQAVRETP